MYSNALGYSFVGYGVGSLFESPRVIKYVVAGFGFKALSHRFTLVRYINHVRIFPQHQ